MTICRRPCKFTIFMERTSSLFADDADLMWLREVIGYALNKIDSQDLVEADVLIAQLQSGIVDLKFSWNRYRMIKKADFMDDLTVVAPEELMGGGPP